MASDQHKDTTNVTRSPGVAVPLREGREARGDNSDEEGRRKETSSDQIIKNEETQL